MDLVKGAKVRVVSSYEFDEQGRPYSTHANAIVTDVQGENVVVKIDHAGNRSQGEIKIVAAADVFEREKAPAKK